ncbi:UDP-N-acetylmuramate dehydrogenase [Coprothermobacteraceae bacterium]|nr:UDP-N-acetylmuramate dehydrogenase [Coprothermobacteraceae bacterium]
MNVKKQRENLKEYSYMRLGPEALVWRAKNSLEVLEDPSFVLDKVVLGNCSKVLLPDIIGEVFLNVDQQPLLDHSEGLLYVSSGTKVSQLMSYAIVHGLDGLDFLAGIPGTVGGLLWMNGGAFGQHVWDVVERARVITDSGEVVWLRPSDLRPEYRRSHLDKAGVRFIVDAVLHYRAGDPVKVQAMVAERVNYRRFRHPMDYPSLGSTFKNGEGYRAWELIQRAGLSGYRIGDAMFSTKHANFLINLGSATREDVLALIELAQVRVRKKFGIDLEPEVVIL